MGESAGAPWDWTEQPAFQFSVPYLIQSSLEEQFPQLKMAQSLSKWHLALLLALKFWELFLSSKKHRKVYVPGVICRLFNEMLAGTGTWNLPLASSRPFTLGCVTPGVGMLGDCARGQLTHRQPHGNHQFSHTWALRIWHRRNSVHEWISGV